MKVKTFIDIAPLSLRTVCNHCKHFMKWGVASGSCLHPNQQTPLNKLHTQTCKKFELK